MDIDSFLLLIQIKSQKVFRVRFNELFLLDGIVDPRSRENLASEEFLRRLAFSIRLNLERIGFVNVIDDTSIVLNKLLEVLSLIAGRDVKG